MATVLRSVRAWAVLAAVSVGLTAIGCGEPAKTTPTDTKKPDATKTETKSSDPKPEEKKPDAAKPSAPAEGGSQTKGKAGGGVDVPGEK